MTMTRRQRRAGEGGASRQAGGAWNTGPGVCLSLRHRADWRPCHPRRVAEERGRCYGSRGAKKKTESEG